MAESGSAIGKIMFAVGRRAAGYRSCLLIEKDGEKFIEPLILSLATESPDSAEADGRLT